MNGLSLDSLVLTVGVVAFLSLLFMWNRDQKNNFSLIELISNSHTGKVELFKLGQLVSLLLSSWVLIHETNEARLTEWQFAGYMLAWAGANLINKVVDNKRLESTTDNKEL